MNELIPQLAEYPRWAGTLGILAFFIFFGCCAALLFVSANAAYGKNAPKSQKRALVALISVALGAVVSLIATSLFFGYSRSVREANENEVAQTVQAREEWVESHGVNVKKDTMENLDFPDTEPKTDEEFGIAQVTKNKAVITITLAWEDGDFVLYGTDGEPLERMEK